MPASAIASARAYSWLGPPRPLPRMVTVSSPPDRITAVCLARAQVARQRGMGRRHLARLAFDIGAERDAFVAGGDDQRLAPRAGSAGRAASAKAACEHGIARLGRFIGRIVEARVPLSGKIELELRDNGARVGERGRIRHGRSRADRRRIVARHVGDGDGDEPRRIGMARQPAALDAREMFAHRVDLADIGAGAQQRARHRLFVGKRNAARRRDPVGARRRPTSAPAPGRWDPHHRPARARGRRLPGRRRREPDVRLRSCGRRASAGHSRGAPPRRRWRAARRQASAGRDKSLPPLRPWSRRLARGQHDQPAPARYLGGGSKQAGTSPGAPRLPQCETDPREKRSIIVNHCCPLFKNLFI